MPKSFVSRGSICALLIVPLVAIFAIALMSHAPAAHIGSFLPASVASFARQPQKVATAVQPRARTNYALLPLVFETNQGQTDAQVQYMARGEGYGVFITGSDAVFALHSRSSDRATIADRGDLQPKAGSESVQHTQKEDLTAVVRMEIVGSNSSAKISATDLLPGKSNYFLGSDPSKWHSGVPQYARVSYQNIYPGINLAFHGVQRQIEFDFIVAPNANSEPINLQFSGARSVQSEDSGNLVVSSRAGGIVLHKPVAYQQKNGARQPVDAAFVLRADNRVSFALGEYDHSRELVIDPSVSYEYSTYLGGTGDDAGEAIAIDSNGNAYIAGDTASTNFPGASGYGGSGDVFVSKISADGSTLLYSTYVGGSGLDGANGIAVDAAGDAFVDGGTESTDFPETSGAFQTGLKGVENGFVFELNPSGSITYSTYFGGTGGDIARGIALDSSGNVYAVGTTSSIDFPTQTPLQPTAAGSFLTKLNSSGTALVYSTYLGASAGDSAFAVAVDSSGNAYVTGKTISPTFHTTPGAFQTTCGSDGTCNGGLADAFVSVINAAGTSYVYSTFLGGSENDYGNGIAVDSSGNAYVTGQTSSSDFPLSSPLQGAYGAGAADAFVTKLNPIGNALVYSTFLGGNQNDIGASIAVDEDSNAYISGQTNSPNFPTAGASQPHAGGGYDAFVSEINGTGSLLTFSTFLGGSQDEDNLGGYGAIAVDSPGANIYVTGNTASTDFPTHLPLQANNGGGGLTDAFAVNYSQQTFTITATPPAPASVAPGSSAASTVTLTSYNGYNSPVNLSASVTNGGSPEPSSISFGFSPASPVTPASAGATTTLTITTAAPTAAIFRSGKFFYAMWLPIAGLSLIGMGCSPSRSRQRKLSGLLMIGTVMTALFLMPACGGGSSTTTQPPPKGGTPAGSYTITITGAGTDANAITQSTQITLTVN